MRVSAPVPSPGALQRRHAQRRTGGVAAGRLLDEGHVPPGVGAERAGVVVRHAQQVEVLARRHAVPLLAGHLAGLAADADRGVGEEPDPRRVVDVPGVARHVVQRAEQAVAHCAAASRADPGPPTVVLDVGPQRGAGRPGSGPHVAGRDLALLDVHVRVGDDAEQVVHHVAGGQPAGPEVVGHPDLVHGLPLHPQRPDPLR